MAHVEIDQERGDIVITSEWRERELCKAVPGARWDNDARRWRMPLSWAACIAARGVFGPGLAVGPLLAEWSRVEYDGRVAPALALREARDIQPIDPYPAKLYPFQRAGAAFLTAASSALLADEMGLGKTAQTIVALGALHAWPTLVVCPNSVKRTWVSELLTWAPGVEAVVVGGGAAARKKQIAAFCTLLDEGRDAVLIVNWEALRLHSRLSGYGSIRLSDDEKTDRELNLIGWASVIADEAHRAKQPQAKQTRALWAVGKNARHRFALTGTPIANSPEDLWAIMRFVSPDEWPSKTRFIDRYCILSWNAFGGMDVTGLRSETRGELFRFLDPRFIRRPKSAVLTELPEKTYVRRHVELTPKQRKSYDDLRDHLLTMLDEGALVASHPLQRLTRLIQFASAHATLDEGGNLSLAEPSATLDDLELVVEEMGGRAVVIAAESRQLIELAALRLQKSGVSHGLITGAVAPADRQVTIDRFQAGDLQVVLLTMGAGGEGITLTAADTIVFLQRSFSSVKNVQTEDRIHRIGQREAVTVIDIVAVDTVQERVLDVMLQKGARLEEVARDAETLRTWLV